MSYWTGLTYSGNWGDYGSGYEPGSFKIDGDRVVLKGSMTNSEEIETLPSLIATLPSGFAPPNIQMLVGLFITVSGEGEAEVAVAIKIDTSGNIYLYYGTGFPITFGADTMICLNGISFSILS